MATLFISDLHLTGERPNIIKLFCEFLREKASKAESLYILGDLFEAWIGDDAVSPDIEPAIAALKKLTSQGVPVFVMAGNRDFLLGKRFESTTGCTLIPDPTLMDLYGTPTLLMHGDTLCTDDIDYQQFRQQVRDPAWQSKFLNKPIEERIAIGKHAREESTARTKEKSEEIMDVNQQAVENAFRENRVNLIIHGHTHRPAIHTLVIDNKPVTRIVLGDWHNQSSILKMDAELCELTPASSSG